ncbi:MAG: DUF488 family protein [Patescibacteria group bacterium]|nr:DUF488 family protein [Patescibacteria group bacterium]MDE1946078.1 DUF488 family protein [Patescibacteria group bacterium]
MVTIKRIYLPWNKNDGCRVLVDRLWPRGVSKRKARLHAWMKDIGPSGDLRIWFGHRKSRWAAFKRKYKKELAGKKDLVAKLRKLEKKFKKLTLLFGAKDEKRNEAVLLAEILRR